VTETVADAPVTTTPSAPQHVVTEPQATAAGDMTTANSAVATAPVTADNNITTPAATDTAVGNTILSLQFNAECWLEVTDATGKRLAYGTRQAGQNERLTGTAPLKVTLGNAAAATVQLNDVAVDLSGYAAGRVARLTLGGQP
jgi:cytoskeleton protein RodZ